MKQQTVNIDDLVKVMGDKFKDFVFPYCRRSLDDADSQKNSLTYQEINNIKSCRHEGKKLALDFSYPGFCENGVIKEQHSGFKEDEMNFDKGRVTYRIVRPKFGILMQLIKRGVIKGTKAYCWDRLSRNDNDGNMLKQMIQQGYDITFATTQYSKSSSGKLHMSIDAMFSNYYSSVMGEKVLEAMKKMRSEGKCTYRTPIGYLDVSPDNKPLDPERAPIVKKMFEMYATGEWSFETLAQWANAQGLMSKPRRRKRTFDELISEIPLEKIEPTSHPITAKTVEHVLRDPFFIGKVLQVKEKKVGEKRIHEWIDGNHIKLVDNATFFKVQAAMKKRTQSVHYPESDFQTYRGLIDCGCKRGYCPYIKKGIVYYQCRCKKGCNNTIRNLSEKKINNLILEVLRKISFTNDELIEIEAKAHDELNKLTDRRNKEIDELNRKRGNLFKDLDYLIHDRITILRQKVMTPEALVAEEARISKELEEVEQRIKACTVATKEILHYVISFSELVKNAALYFQYAHDSEKHAIVTQVFSELSIENGKLKYQAKEGFDALLRRYDGQNALIGDPTENRTLI